MKIANKVIENIHQPLVTLSLIPISITPYQIKISFHQNGQ
jgi:hypothetical protein